MAKGGPAHFNRCTSRPRDLVKNADSESVGL